MDTVKLAIVGLGERGEQLIKDVLLKMDDVEIIGVCDLYEDRIENAAKLVVDSGRKEPFKTKDYRDFLTLEGVDAIMAYTSWDMHTEVCIAAMKAGIPTASEVGCEYALDNCWRLVHTQEETGTPYMFLENCCYGKEELFATAMARKGLFGEIVHCSGMYGHDLRSQVAGGLQERHYRYRNYLHRCTENYPTHELGPIAKLLNINRGNRLVSVTAIASKSAGVQAYVKKHADEKNYPEEVRNADFRQGDIVITLLTCENGESILMTLDTSLPRSHYSRAFNVRGTFGSYNQDTHTLFLEDVHPERWKFSEALLNNAKEYEEEHMPKMWKEITPEAQAVGHGGMDYFTHRAFIEALKNKTPMPIDVYDAATWLAVSVLAEESIREGGTPKAIPDFTNGKWMYRPAQDVAELG